MLQVVSANACILDCAWKEGEGEDDARYAQSCPHGRNSLLLAPRVSSATGYLVVTYLMSRTMVVYIVSSPSPRLTMF